MHDFKLGTLNMELRTVLICLILFLIPTLSPAREFTADTIGDYGNVTVMEVTGNYDAKKPDGTVNDIPRQVIAKEFFRLHKDEYDFLVIYSNFDFQMPDEDTKAFYLGVKNDTEGIGQKVFDNSNLYGSSGKLQGIIDMGDISNLVTDPLAPEFEETLSILAHEYMHRWGAYVKFKDADGAVSPAILGQDDSHWSFLLDTGGSVLYGNDWQDNGDGTFTSIGAGKYYNPLDLYLMGLRDKSQVPPMLLIDNPDIDPERLPEKGTTIEGTSQYITIDDIIAAEGERIPGSAESRKTFRTGFILITAPGTFTGYEIYGIENIRSGWITRFSILTDGQGIMQVALSPKEDIPFNPGVIPPSVNPRTLPPDIDDGVTWLMNTQGTDGSWMYLPQTAGRDTAVAVLALKNFDAAQRNYLKGLQWLNDADPGNMDYLSRKIEAMAEAGRDITALMDDLFSGQNPDGGWGSNNAYMSNPVDTSIALKAIAAAGYSGRDVISNAVEYLKSEQNVDGGWGSDDEASTVQATANVLSAFNKYREEYRLDGYIESGIAWLLSRQNPDGGFGNSPSTVYDSALATLVLREFDISTDITNNSLNYILNMQSDDGSWYKSPYQTALAVRAVWKATIDPDLSVKSSDITFIPSSVTSLPSTVVINAEIWNLGKTDVAGAKVTLYEGAVSGRNKAGEQTLAFPGRSPVTVTFPVTVTDGGARRFYISVDTENLVKESNESNNTALRILSPQATSDFEISDADISVSVNPVDIFEDVTISSNITNRGTMDAYDVQLRYYIDETGEPFDIAASTVDIPAGATVTNEITWRTNRAGENLPVTVSVDPFNSFEELSETNNRAVTYLTVNDATGPNLTVSYRDIVITPAPAEELGNATVSAVVRNEGFSGALNINVNFYKGVPGEGGSLIGTQVIPSLNAGESSTVSIDWTGITASGERIIYIQADPDDLIKEIKEDDNDAFTTLKILSLPDFAISTYSLSFAPAFPTDGDRVSIAVTIQNRGEQGAQNVTVTALEGDTLIGSQAVPSIAGLSQADAAFVYDTSGKPGVHEVTVIVDPGNAVTEISEDNNRASGTFGVQDANLWLTEHYISPDGDGVKDSTRFFFRLETPRTVKIVVVNDKDEIVRTFSGSEFENTRGGSITWDGLNDYGMVAGDGEYQIRITDFNNNALGGLPVILDNNRSPLSDAVGTKYLLNTNITCMLPDVPEERRDWLPDESGIVFTIPDGYAGNPDYPEGIYTMSPDGEDIVRVVPPDWTEDNPDYRYYNFRHYLSPDGEKIAFALDKNDRDTNVTVSELWVVDTDGSNLTMVFSNDVTRAYLSNNIKWSPDGEYIIYQVYSPDELWIVKPDGSGKTRIDSDVRIDFYYLQWSPDSRRMAYSPGNDLYYRKTVRISETSGGKKDVLTAGEYGYIDYIEWLNNQKIVVAELDTTIYPWTKKLRLVDADKDGGQIKLADDVNNETSVSPDGQSIAFVTFENSTEYLNISGAEGNPYVLYERPEATEGCVMSLRGLLWSPDSRKIASVEGNFHEHCGVFFCLVECAVPCPGDEESNLLVVDMKTGEKTSSALSVPEMRLIEWLSDGVSLVGLDYNNWSDVYIINSGTGGSRYILHDVIVPGGEDKLVSPHGRYITYYKDVEESSVCYDRGYEDLWTISSLLNLTADLRVIRNKSAVILKGTAADLNFDGYTLEYADIRNPDVWNPLAPPSDVPVVNDVFTTWVPPYEGTFNVRLTVRDRAGNTAIKIKRVSWGIFSSITGLYKTGEIFSPNSDGVKDSVELHYRVLEPVHLEFNIHDEDGRLIRTFYKDYTSPSEDYITWDGRDGSGRFVPDGTYSIKVFNYEFFVKVDNTPPDVTAALTDIVLKSGEEEITGRYYYYLAGLRGHAVDSNLKYWALEYGEGDNPREWVELKRGEDLLAGQDEYGAPILNPAEDTAIMSFRGAGIGWLGNRKFRITVEDFAGNRGSFTSGMVEEKILFYGWDGEYLDKPSIIDVSGLHTIGAAETVREPLASLTVQYKKTAARVWEEGAVVLNPQSYDVEIPWDTSNLDPDLAYTVRIKAVDITGNEYYSDTVFLGHVFSMKFDCESPAVVSAANSVEELVLLKFRIMSEEDPNYAVWTDFAVYDAAEGDIIPTGEFTVSLPGDLQNDISYSIKMSGTGVSGRTYSTLTQTGCGGVYLFKFGLNVRPAESTACNLSAPGRVNLRAPILLGGSIVERVKLKSLTYYIQKSPETWDVLGSFDLSTEQAGPVTIDTGGMAEGIYPVKAVFAYLRDGSYKEMEDRGSFAVDRELPSAGITYPVGSLMLCPLKVSGPKGDWYGIPVEGYATDNMQVKSYELFYSTGENPDDWLPALTRRITDGRTVPVSGQGTVQGRIGIWDITNLEGTVFYLRLRVADAAGNVSCYTVPSAFFIDKAVETAGLSLDKGLFSPNGDGISDDLQISYEIDEYALVDVRVFKLIRTATGGYMPDSAPVRTIESGTGHIAGIENTSWDGRDDSGSVVPDGKYGVFVIATDSCKNTGQRWVAAEIDNTPPSTIIDYPKPSGPVGNIIEVRGSADDPHFRGYVLEFGQGAAPAEWFTVSQKSAPVKNSILGRWNNFGLEGIWTLRLTAADTAGNESAAAVTIDLGERKDLIKDLAATPQLFSPNNDGRLDTTNIRYELTGASDIKIEIFDSEYILKKTYATSIPSAGTYSYMWDGRDDNGIIVSDGGYVIRLTAALSPVTQEEEITVSVDTAAPVVDIKQPPEDSYIKTPDVTVNGTISDENLSEYSITYTGDAGAELLDNAGQSREDYTFGILNDFPEGSYRLDISAKDRGENTTVKSIVFTIDRTPPETTLETPEDGEYYGSDRNIIRITGSIEEKNLETYSLRYGSGESPSEWRELLTGDTLPAAPQLFEWKVGNDDGIPDGLYTLSLYAKDRAGFETEVKRRITIDNTPPEVLITSPRDGDYVTMPVDVKGTAFDQNLDNYTVEFSEGNCSDAFKWASVKKAGSPVQDGSLAAWQALPPDGDYCLRLTADDKPGNRTEAKTNVKVDTHPPAPPVLSGETENKADAGLDWTRNTEPDLAGYNIYRDNQKINTEPVTGNHHLDRDLAEGIHTYTVKAVDLAGLESEPSNEIRITIDLTGPDARIGSPRGSSKVSGVVDIKGTAYSSDDFRQYRVYTGRGAEPSAWSLIRTSPVPVSYGTLTQWDTTGLGEGDIYSIRLEAEDVAGNINMHRITVSIDNTPPAKPVLISAVPGDSDITVSWQANTEPDLAGYLLYRNGRLANVPGTVIGDLTPYLLTGTTYLDAALPDGKFRYYIVAMDEAGNISDPSNSIGAAIDTHAPQATITEPEDGLKFEDRILINAESADLDTASVQFQYKKAEDTTWINLGDAVTTQPYTAYLDPAGLVLSYGDYNLRAVATDEAGRTDPSPLFITVAYTDLTAPDAPRGLNALTDGSDVTLAWTANTEADIDGYNIYRTVDSAKIKINSETVKETTYADSGLADGTYSYEITATDTYGNESKPSGIAPAKIYAPLIEQPFTPAGENVVLINGGNAGEDSTVGIYVEDVSGSVLQVKTSSDSQGRFNADVTLAPGENRITAKAVDAKGNTSRASNEIVVVYNEPPAAPAGPVLDVNGYDVNLAWEPNTEPDLSGYNLYRNGEKLNEPSAVTSGSASASSLSYYPSMAFDSDSSTYWHTATYGSPAWWQIDMPAPELINHMEVHWESEEHAAKDYEIRVWSGYAWITLVKVTGNPAKDKAFDFSPPYRTDRIRIYINDTTYMDYFKELRLSEVILVKDNLITDTGYNDAGIGDGEYTYKVTAVDYYGFESLPSDDARAIVGDIIPPPQPQGLTAAASGADIVLNWSANPAPDLSGYNIYRNTSEGWSRINTSLITETAYTDAGIPNGTYTYRVTAMDAAGNESLPSNEASATVYIEPPRPPVKLGITAVPEGEALGAAWEYAGSPAAGYNIYRSDVSGGPYVMLNTVLLNEKSYTDTGLVNGTAYYYVVTTVDTSGNESAYSVEAAGIPSDTTAPPAPEIFFPAVPGTPVVSYKDRTDVAGSAEPGITVELFRNSIFAGSTTALAGDVPDSLELDYESGASLSPDAKMIAYSYNNRVWIMDISTGEKKGMGKGYWPQWSPDGKKIAYSFYDTNGDYRFAVYDTETGKSTPLTDETGVNEWGLSWSSDGTRAAFVNQNGGQYEIWLKDMAAGTSRLIRSGTYYQPAPRLSPGGGKIAYFENNSLYIVDLAAGDTVLADDDISSGPGNIEWSPDGRKLAFAAYANENMDIFVLDIETLVRTQITASPDRTELDPEWSPDGDYIAFRRLEGDGISSIWVTSSHAPGRERLIQQGRYNLKYFYRKHLCWTKPGGIAYIDGDTLNTVYLRGWFRFEDIELEPGDNTFHARTVDPAGNASLPSGGINVTFDTSLTPDLETTEDDIFIYPLYPSDGEEIAIDVFVRNISRAVAKDVDADIYIWDSSGNLELIKSESIPYIPPGSWKTVSVEWDTTGKTGVNTVIAVIDPGDRIAELSETNNYATRDLVVVEGEGVSMTTTLDSGRYGGSVDMNIDINLINSGPEKDVVVEVWIEDENGNAVTLLDTISSNLPYAAGQDYSVAWNTGSAYAGSYRAHTVLKDITGVVSENIVPFEILPDINIASEVVTDRTGYGAKEDVGININVRNNGGNYVIPALTAIVKIADAGGNILFTDDKTIINLLPGASAALDSAWNTGLNAPGNYRATVEIYLDGRPVSGKSAPFTINAAMVITGDIKAAPAVVSSGNTVEADYMVRNSGNTDADSLGLRIFVIDPGTWTVMDTYEDITDLAVNGSHTGRFTFSTQGYGLKTYSLAMQYIYQGSAESVAAATVTVRDGTPPAVSIISPEAGGQYASAVEISALVSDNASGVDRVEYRLDNGPWHMLPVSGLSEGRYSAVWEPAGLSDEGGHTVSVRATDRSGNISGPAEASFAVEFIPPVADAGPDRNVIAGETVTLDGSASYDPSGETITFLWTFKETPAASAVTGESLSDAAGAKPAFTTDVEGTYVLELTVDNGKKQDSDTVSIIAGIPNVAPNADAGPDRSVFTGTPVYLDGSASYDPDEWPEPLKFNWSFNKVPLQSVLADNDIIDIDRANASFIPDADGAYVLELTVSDGDLSSTDDVVITATAPNVPPNADAGEDFSVTLGGTVTLDGSASHDPDGGPEPLTYTWGFVAAPDGSGITDADLSYAGTVSPSFVPDRAGTYVLELMVGDGLETAYDNVAVTVIDITPPSISAVANTYELWPPDHRLVDIVIRVYTNDNSGLPVTLTAVVRSNEPVNGRCDGNTSPDWTEPVIDQDTGIITLQLRAERSGCGDGRVYTITITAEDVSGNRASTDVLITVPRSQGRK